MCGQATSLRFRYDPRRRATRIRMTEIPRLGLTCLSYPNEHLQHSSYGLAHLHQETPGGGTEPVFVTQGNVHLIGRPGENGRVVQATIVDPWLLEKMLADDPEIQKIAQQALEAGCYTLPLRSAMELAVTDVIETEYLVHVLDTLAQRKTQIAEYLCFRVAGEIALEQSNTATRKHRAEC